MTAAQGQPLQQHTLPMFWLFIACLASSASTRLCDPMLPTLSQHFQVSTSDATLTISGYALAYGVLQLLFGPLGDYFGKRSTIEWATIACALANGAAALAFSFGTLVFARVMSGAAAAAITPLVLAWVSDTVRYGERQAAMARFLSASVLGSVAGQWVSAVLTQWLGWRCVFAVLALLFLMAGIAIQRQPGNNSALPQRDPKSTVWGSTGEVLRQRWARTILLMVTIEGALSFCALSFLPTFLVHEFGLSLTAAASIVLLYAVGGFAYTTAAVRVLPRLGESGLALVGGLSMAAAWIGLAAIHLWPFTLLASVAAGLGFYSLHGVMQIQATQLVPQRRGTALARIFHQQQVGGLVPKRVFIGI